ncbi:MAG TPA: sugar phosphate isomerase/epimerase [Isosphaeraceae bacterium]|jgi:sugar phosphate isomerase/epimerase
MIACINQVTTLSTPFEADIPALARAGWPAVELWLTKLEAFLGAHPVAEAKALLEGEGLPAVAASSQGGLLLSSGPARQEHWAHYRRRLEILAELGVSTLVVAADFAVEPAEADYGRASAALAEAAEVARPFGVRLALEFQKTARFCASLDTTLALIAQSGAEGVGVCLDLFHYYTGPSKFEDLAYLSPGNLAWVQASDLSGTPRELAGDADRIFPGDGDFQTGPILDHLARIGYDGHVSLEVLNPQLWRIPVEQVAAVGLQALLRVLGDRRRPNVARDRP